MNTLMIRRSLECNNIKSKNLPRNILQPKSGFVAVWFCLCLLVCHSYGFLYATQPPTNGPITSSNQVSQRERRASSWILLDRRVPEMDDEAELVTSSSQSTPSSFKSSSKENPSRGGAGPGPRRPGPNRKTQLRWIAQSVAKLHPRKDVNDSYNKNNNKNVTTADLVQCLEYLSSAQTQDQVMRIGNRLSACVAEEREHLSLPVQERIIKAAATTGLFHLAMNLTTDMLSNDEIPSEITQDALCSSLRRAGRVNQIEKFLLAMGSVAKQKQRPNNNDNNNDISSPGISTSSFNVMLAAFCDDTTTSRDQQGLMIHKAWTWIAENNKAKDELGVTPGSIAFATILQAAARNGNRTLANEAWALMKERGIRPNPFCYNARLKLAGKGSMINRNEEIYQIWQELQQDPAIQPDRFTIDLVLPTLSQRGQVDQIKQLLDDFVMKNSRFLASNAFAPFLITLTNSGELKMAREIFDIYLKPSYGAAAATTFGDARNHRLVTASSRHYNVILGGYAREIDTIKKSIGKETEAASIAIEKLRKAAWGVYSDLLSSRTVNPDEFTVTIMMGLVSSPEEVCELIEVATEEFNGVSAVLQRAAVTALGELGDASSACWFFARHVLPSPKTTLREWNVLMVALSKCAVHQNSTRIDFSRSSAFLYFNLDEPDESNTSPLLQLLDGSSPGEATEKVLQLLISGSDKEVKVAKPDSQTFCLVVSALNHEEMNGEKALSIFRQSREIGVPADGRFVNAVLRCYGPDIQGAVNAWKEEIRPACVDFETRNRKAPPSVRRSKGKNLVAAYNGLLYCSGRALRPDIGLRLVYAMAKEGLEPNEKSLNAYRSGKRLRQALVKENAATSFARKLALLDPYESLLFVECTKYDRNDRRRSGERRVRIIV